MTETRSLINWREAVLRHSVGIEIRPSGVVANVRIYSLDRAGNTVRIFTLIDGWPSEMVYSGLSASSNTIAIEEMHFVYDRIEVL